jgi:hypothetical protein
MRLNHIIPSKILLLVIACGLLSACSGNSSKSALQAENTDTIDFSGSWELNYGQSDNIQTKLDSLVRDLRRQAERRNNANGGLNQGAPGASLMVGGGANSGASIIGLARMSELITRSSLLTIVQDDERINVKREETFALTCDFFPGEFRTVETPFGTETCGWNGHQLLFRIRLPEGLSIQHVMTLGPEGERLNIATTVVSDQVSYPFTLNRVYNRFLPGSSGFRCKQTLSRGRVCTTESP